MHKNPCPIYWVHLKRLKDFSLKEIPMKFFRTLTHFRISLNKERKFLKISLNFFHSLPTIPSFTSVYTRKKIWHIRIQSQA